MDLDGRDITRVLESTRMSRGESSPLLYEYIRTLLKTRSAALTAAARATPWSQRREQVSSGLRRAIGNYDCPEWTVRSEVTGVIEEREYRIEKVVLETRPQWYLTCNLYIPNGVTTPVPGILHVHGHGALGKSYPEYQKRYAYLARAGFVVLAPDMIGYNERRGMGHEQTYPWLAGLTVQGLMVWDNMRAVDYLLKREEVDASRIGCTGGSGGGTQTIYLAALDERIRAAVPTHAVCMFRHHQENTHVYCPCEVIPRAMEFAEVPDVLGLIAPRPLLIIAGTLDTTFPVPGARAAFEHVREIYRQCEAADNVAYFETYVPHAFPTEAYGAMTEWFERWLGKPERRPDTDQDSVRPLTVYVEEPKALSCFPEGKLPEQARGLDEIYAEVTSSLQPFYTPDQLRDQTTSARAREQIWTEVLGGRPDRDPLRLQCLDRREWGDGATVEKLLFWSEPYIPIPALLFRPSAQKEGKLESAVVYVSPQGKRTAPFDRHVQGLLDRGLAVLAVDVRGYGETQYTGYERDLGLALSAAMHGRQLFGMRVWDILVSVDLLREPPFRCEKVALWGRRECGLYCQGAAALGAPERVAAVVAQDALATFQSNRGFSGWPDAIFVPNLLQYVDMAGLVSLSPASVLFARPLGPTGEPMSADAFWQGLPGVDRSRVSLVTDASILERQERVAQWLECKLIAISGGD
jgi:dienelactone hydrolase